MVTAVNGCDERNLGDFHEPERMRAVHPWARKLLK
jgi:hypothetical protein